MKKIYLTIPLFLFVVDRLVKHFASSINFGGGFVKIGLYKNYAGAFSLPIAGIIYNVIGVVLILVFVYLLINDFKKVSAYSFIILGGISNIFDRLYFGYAIDYVQVIGRSFFNLADVMLIIGVGILVFGELKNRGDKKI